MHEWDLCVVMRELQAEQLREHGFRSHEHHNIFLESSDAKRDADSSQIRNITFRSGKVAGECNTHSVTFNAPSIEHTSESYVAIRL